LTEYDAYRLSDTADASDHEGAAKAIAKGLASGHSKENPGFWLHTGGAGILCWETMRDDNKLGEWSEREYNDWTAVQDLVNLPEDAFHKNVDTVVLSSGNEAVKTAILCPPTIYGRWLYFTLRNHDERMTTDMS
jgi:hypothetical protein